MGYVSILGTRLHIADSIYLRAQSLSAYSDSTVGLAELIIDGGATSANWREINQGSLYCKGNPGFMSTLRMSGMRYNVMNAGIIVQSYCKAVVHDVTFSYLSGVMIGHNGECTGVDLSTSWTNLTFNRDEDSIGMSSHANCLGSGPLNIYPNGTGGPDYLPATANDAGGIFVFH